MIEYLSQMNEKDLKSVYSSSLKSISNDEQVLMSFYGSISEDLIYSLAQSLEDLLISLSVSKTTLKRIFSIFVEGLKNILLFASKSELNEKIGFVIVLKTATHFKIVFGNLVPMVDKISLEKYCENLSDLDKKQLQNLYEKTLATSFVKNVNTSGVGLLIMGLKSDGKLNYRFIDMNEFFVLFTTQSIIGKTELV